MKLTRQERWVLSNQYRALEKLYPNEADGFRTVREALERGYELNYGSYADFIYADTMTTQNCSEAIDIMEMYWEMEHAYGKLKDKSGIKESDIRFPGFSGNDETSYMGYARFLRDREGKFEGLHRGDNFNSHFPMLETYRAMLPVWKAALERKGTGDLLLTKEDITQILQARHRRGQ